MLLAATFAVLTLFSSDAFAARFHGTFECSDCRLDIANDAETRAFIASTVNASVTAWNNGDTVVICNSEQCTVFTMTNNFLGLAGLQPTYTALRNPGPVGGSGGGGGGSGSGGGSSTGIVGYRPIIMTATVCALGTCSSQQVVVGYEPIFGPVRTHAR